MILLITIRRLKLVILRSHIRYKEMVVTEKIEKLKNELAEIRRGEWISLKKKK